MLVWNITKGRSVIPKSVSADRIQANYEIDGLELTEEDIKVIDSMQGRFKVCDASFLPQNYKEKVFYHDDE
jgi:glycerol 2-dehydrogenase (NADP+)